MRPPSGSACARPSRWRRRAPCIPILTSVPEDAAADAHLLDGHRRLVRCAIRRWSRSMRPTACCSTSPAARICSAARRRCVDDLAATHVRFRLCGARRHRRHHRRGLGRGAVRPMRHRRSAMNARRWRRCRSQALRLAPTRRSRRWPRRPQAHRRYHGHAARAARRALRRRSAPPARPRARAASASRCRRACRSRLMSPSSAFAEPIAREEDVLAVTSGWRGGWQGAAGAARRRRAPRRAGAVPHRRQCSGASRPAPRGRCAIREAIRALFVERLAALGDRARSRLRLRSGAASVSSPPSPARRSRSASAGRATTTARSTGWSTA